MFWEYGRGELCSPANNRKTKTGDQWSPLQTNFGRDIVFSADLCYNGANEKPPLCKGRWQPKADGGIVKKLKIAENNPSVATATAPFTQGSLGMCATIGVWALPLYYKGETGDKRREKCFSQRKRKYRNT